jgi:ABC-type molybdate transport system ATPase subunit
MPKLVVKNVVATITPEDISISKSVKHPNNEASNSVAGIITEMVQMRSTAQITVDAGFLLKTRISLSTIKDLGMNLGDKIYVGFNDTALNVFEENSCE